MEARQGPLCIPSVGQPVGHLVKLTLGFWSLKYQSRRNWSYRSAHGIPKAVEKKEMPQKESAMGNTGASEYCTFCGFPCQMRDLGLASEPWKKILEITVALAVPWRYGVIHPPDPSGLGCWLRLDSRGRQA